MGEELLKDKLKLEDITEERFNELTDKVLKAWLHPIEEIPEVHRSKEDAVMGKFKTLFDLRIQLIHHSFKPLSMPDENCLVIKDAKTREEIIYNVESKEDIKEFLCQYIDDLFEEPVEDWEY